MADITPIASLNGELSMPEKVWMQGPPGLKGDPGAAATVTVGTVTTGEPGTDAIITNSGTESAAVLNFTIPKGENGAGVPDGGTAGQLLGKTESGTAWIDPPQSGGGVTTLHINVTSINMETLDLTFTADKTPAEMRQAALNGPIWCIVTFAAGVMSEEALSLGIPPAWWGINTVAFGSRTLPVHNKDGENDVALAVSGRPNIGWSIDLPAFAGD